MHFVIDTNIKLEEDLAAGEAQADVTLTLAAYEGDHQIAVKEFAIDHLQKYGKETSWHKLEIKAGEDRILSYEGYGDAKSAAALGPEGEQRFDFFMAQLANASQAGGRLQHRIDASTMPVRLRDFLLGLCRGNLNP